MSALTSPYNSPYAQFTRLSQLRQQYQRENKTTGWGPATLGWAFWLIIFAVIFAKVGLPQLALLSFLGIFIAPTVYTVRYFAHVSRYPHDYLTCPYCKDQISIATSWICGHCQRQNTPDFNKDAHPTFVEKCARCNLVPHSFACRKCGKPIVFRVGEYEQSSEEIAYITGFPPPPVEHRDTLDERRERIRKRWQ